MPAGRKTIHLFAEIWESQFRCHRAHPSLFFIEDFDKWFGKECDFLGFQMDCGYQFADRLEKATIDTIEEGYMTKDLAMITTLPEVHVLNSEGFIKAIAERL